MSGGSTPPVRRDRRRAPVAIAATCLALLLGEAVVRVGEARLGRSPVVRSDPYAGWRGQPGMHEVIRAFGGGPFRFSTDSHGRRLVTSGAAGSGAPAVVILGDSFAQGIGVDDAETFPCRLGAALPHRRIVDLGVAGYGTDQELVSLERFLSDERRMTVSDVVAVVFENDLVDVQRSFDPYLGRSKPRFEVHDGVLVRPEFHLPMRERLMDASALAWLTLSRAGGAIVPRTLAPHPGLPVVLACLEAIESRSRERNARLHVLAHRRLAGPSTVDDVDWDALLLGSRALDLTPLLRAHPGMVGGDGVHWSAAGHALVSGLLQERIQGPG